jgi:hypothetical protein
MNQLGRALAPHAAALFAAAGDARRFLEFFVVIA